MNGEIGGWKRVEPNGGGLHPAVEQYYLRMLMIEYQRKHA